MNFKKYHVSANLIDADSYYGEYKSGNSYTATALQFNNKKIYPFNAADIGKKFTISCEITNLSSTNVRWQAVTGGETTDGVARSSVGVIQLTFTVVSIDDYIRVTYGSGNALMTITNVMLNSGNTSLPYEPYGNTWHDIPHYIHNTSTDIITTLPAVLYPNDTTATVGLKGQMEQSSTPSPTSPVMPQGCGNKTANLFDSSSISLVPVSTSATRSGTNLGILPQGDYVLSATATAGATQLYRTIKDGNNYTFETIRELPYTFTADGTSEQIIRTSGSNFTSWASTGYTNIMLNTGSTPLPYEPWGIEIPILSANTTTPVYLSEVQTTRRIKKLVLTGEETTWIVRPNTAHTFGVGLGTERSLNNAGLSSHYIPIAAADFDNATGFYVRNTGTLYISDLNYSSLDDYKSYVATQYSSGNPICVWYVLETSQTTILNEPLRKIGDYADTVSGITIPTITGKDTFDVQTALKPSEVSLAYTGWHDATVKEWDGSEWQ